MPEKKLTPVKIYFCLNLTTSWRAPITLTVSKKPFNTETPIFIHA